MTVTALLLALHTGFVDLYHAAVGDLLEQPEKRGFVVAHTRILILSSYVSNADRFAGESAADKSLSEVLAPSERQHHVIGTRLSGSAVQRMQASDGS